MAHPSLIAAIGSFDRLPLASAVFTLDGTIIAANRVAVELLGRPVDQLVGRKAWEFAPGGEHIWDDAIRGARRQGMYKGEIAVATPRGVRHLHYVMTLRQHEEHTFAVMFSVELSAGANNAPLLDLDSRDRLEALGLVAGGIAHDFNNQLISVLGEGTVITVWLPITVGAEPQRRRSASQQSSPTRLHGYRMLVADQEPSVRNTVRRLLERRGAIVVLAGDGDNAEAKLREGSYHLVLLDVMMVKKTGYEVLPIARALQPQAKIVLMSGYTEDNRGAGGQGEPDAVLEKPFTANTLDRAIDGLINTR